MLNPVFQALRANDPWEQLIANIVTFESQPRFDLEQKMQQAEQLKSVLSDVDSKLSSLHTLTKSFTDLISNPFAAKSAVVPSGAGFSVTASDAAGLGSHSVQVEQLASTDQRISKQYNRTGTTIKDFFDANGSQTFSISVFSPTDADPENRFDVSVTVDPTGTDDHAILREISDAIDEAMAQAVQDGDIRSSARADASLITETSSVARLTIRSGDTGFDNRLSFNDSGDGLLSLLQVNRGAVVDLDQPTIPAAPASITGSTVGDIFPYTVVNGNRRFNINVNGTQYNARIEKITYNDLDELAAALDEAIGAPDLSVTVVDGAIKLETTNTGSDATLEITGGNGIDELGFSSTSEIAGTDESGNEGGMLKDVGTSETDSELNARFTLDGLTLYRSTNQVADAVAGVTLDLESVTTSATEFVVDADSGSIKGQIEEFMSTYNSLLSQISDQTYVDGDLDVRGSLAGDSTFTNLRLTLRTQLARQVTGQPDGAPTLLTQIGIDVNDNGTLEIADEEELLEAVKDDPGAVRSLFDGTDGIATRLTDVLESYVKGTNSIMDTRLDSIDDRIRQIEGRLDRFDERIGRRETQLREEFARVQELISGFQSQQNFLAGFGF